MLDHDDRGVSVAVTHVLTVGITAILISGLLIAGSSLLETEQERTTEATLETIGERLAGEISAADRTLDGSDDSVRTSHQGSAGGAGYTVSLETGDCASYSLLDRGPCVVLDSHGDSVTVAIPLAEEVSVDSGTSVSGGDIEITRDGTEITLEAGS